MTGKGRLQRFEHRLERAIVGSFAKAFRSEVQPVEIASAVRRSMDDHATNMTRGRTFVPHRYTVELSETDYERLTAYADDVEAELIAAAAEHADSQHYGTKAAFEMEFTQDPALETGLFRIYAGGADEHPRPRGGRSYAARPAGDAADSARGASGSAAGDSGSKRGAAGSAGGDAAPRRGGPGEAASAPATPDSEGDVGDDHSEGSDSWATATRPPAPPGSPGSPALSAPPGRRDEQHQRDLQRDGTYEPEFPAAYGEEHRAPRPPWRPAPAPEAPAVHPAPAGRDVQGGSGGAGQHVSPAAPHGGVPARHIAPADRPWVEIDGDRYPLLGPLTVLGRDTDAGIVLDDANVSRRHSEVRVTSDGPHLVVNLKDLGSTNGTWVNGERVSSVRLHDRDRITIGQSELIFHAGRR